MRVDLVGVYEIFFFFIYFVHKIGIDVGRSETLTDIDLTVGRPSIDPAIDCLID